MPNTDQAKKRLRQDAKRSDQNKVTRSSMRTAMKHVLSAETAEAGKAAMVIAQKRIDKATKLHIIHAKAGARYKSRLTKRVAALTA